MVYANGHNWGNKLNWDGLGISSLIFAGVYSIIFYAMCAIVWANRKHPVIKMRNMGLAIASLLVLHVYFFMIFLAYVLNGSYPCELEFWIMSFYLPIGIGLFQAQNQQLLLVSRTQSKLIYMEDTFKSLPPPRPGFARWSFKFRQWWAQWTEQSKYEGFLAVGMVLQLTVSTIIFLISRKFTGFGSVSQHVSVGACRRGWEWAPSIAWQFLWNWILGPILIWKIRMIRDIYHWRLQTILCIIAGLPGSPMWLVSTYSDDFAYVNKYWVPAAWFLPGIVTMEMATLGFPIFQVFYHKRAVYKTTRAIHQWELNKSLGFSTGSSMITGSSKDYQPTVSDLEDCLRNNHYPFLLFSSTEAYCAESVKFLIKVMNFKNQWDTVFIKAGAEVERAHRALYRAALDIYLSFVYHPTADQQINVESKYYEDLKLLFSAAANLIASDRPPTPNSTSSKSIVAPWDEPLIDQSNDRTERLQMASLGPRESSDGLSTQLIVNLNQPADPNDKLLGFKIPAEFGKHCFDGAYRSIVTMIWSGPWQHFLTSNKLEQSTQRSL